MFIPKVFNILVHTHMLVLRVWERRMDRGRKEEKKEGVRESYSQVLTH